MSYIKNRNALLAAGDAELRRVALDIAEQGIAAADPAVRLREILRMQGNTLYVEHLRFELDAQRRVFVIGAGKASFPIAKAIDDIVGAHIHAGLVTCKEGQEGQLQHIGLHHAAHPVPSAASLQAAEQTETLLQQVRAGDIVLCCFTGGSSSLFVKPVPGVSLEDKAQANRLLLTCGANIEEINDVRKHLSQVKGGRLIRPLPAGTHVINLTVSDVIGDALDYITDPSFADRSTFADAQAVLDKYALWERMPPTVSAHLRQAPSEAETIKAADLEHLLRHDVLLVRTDAACSGAASASRAAGYAPVVLSTLFEGESSVLGRNLVAIARQILLDGHPVSPPCVLIGGGETTVTVNGHAGQGGPNQEFAVSAALELCGTEGIVALGLDTDGTDGPTRFAGGIADGQTRSLAQQAGHDLHNALRLHDVTPVLESIAHAIDTGATGTNVNDLKLIVIGGPRHAHALL
ncbi:glycerate kinase type-2 family protein [Pseudomonas putida]